MSKGRLEAFSDGVMAIVITILVLSITPPKGDSFGELLEVSNSLLIYLISFGVVAIYWNNHHHLFQLIDKIDGKVLWANSFFLFSLTLFPFATDWISQHPFSLYPSLFYGVVMVLADIAFLCVLYTLKECNDKEVYIKKTVITIVISILAIFLGIIIAPFLIILIDVLMLLIWVVPSKKIESHLNSSDENGV